MTTATRHLGHCQICEGEFKLHEGNMVHHGYRRPGTGFIIGDCYGVGHLPYQKSCELVKQYLVIVQGWLKNSTEYLQKLTEGSITTLKISVWNFGSKEPKIVKKSEKTEREWGILIDRQIQATKYDIHNIEQDIQRLEKRIADWKLVETRTVEEVLEEQRQAKAERDVIRNAKRAVRQAKEQATRDRQAALQARRDVIKADIIAKIKELAALPFPPDKEFQKLRSSMRKAEWLWWNRQYDECSAEMKKLRLLYNGEIDHSH